MNSYAPTVAGVVGRLKEARLRLVAQGVLNAACWALTAALTLFAILELFRRLRLGWWQDSLGPQEMPSLALAATLAGAVILAGGVVIAILRSPRIEQLARRADQAFGLRERISTALEIERRTAAAGDRPAVVAAMIADALRHSGAVSPAVLAAFRLPRSALLVPLAAIAGAAVMLLVQASAIPVYDPVESSLSATLDADQRAAAVHDIHRAADVIEAEAIAHNDAYMQAVANTLEDLGERIALTPDTTRGEILKALDALKGHAAVAGGQWRMKAGESIPRLIEKLEESIALSRMNQTLAAQAGGEADELDSLGQTGSSKPPVPTLTLDSMLEELERRNDAARAAASGEIGADAEILDFIKSEEAQVAPASPDASQNSNVQASGVQADGVAENRLPGDVDDSIGDDVFGQESEGIGNAPVAELVDLETVTDMVLTGKDTGEGDSIEIEITPDAKLTEITQQGLAANTGSWRRSTEPEAERYAIGIDDRDTVSRYLRSLLGSAQK